MTRLAKTKERIVAIYMKYGDIDGAVTTTGFEKWIELSSFQWGVGRGIGYRCTRRGNP